MNEKIVQYLTENKDQYTQASLVEQLRKVGHAEDAIAQAVQAVYGEVQVPVPEVPAQTQVKYAGFWMRLAAAIIDALVLMIGAGILLTPLDLMIGDSIVATDLLYRFGVPILMILYYFVMTNKYQATLGKMALGIKVCDARSFQKASSRTIIIRESIARIIQVIPLLNLVHVIIAFTSKKQGVHDMIAKTVVVHKDAHKKNGVLIAVIILCVVFVMIAFIGILSSIVLVSLGSARDSAKEASVRSSISSTLPSAILCMDSGYDLSEPVSGEPICFDSNGVWPSLEPHGQWDTLLDGDVGDEPFAYSATYGDKGEKRVICTELGCEFPQ
jgi:uncharacterized RDD family membrane protein YckC